ncbi:CPBP family intramembrane glutamic endopeptidase [uncultured Chloroflexus sp.]|uniref:CPBP family intramembrane glutamic endopeptidase n=1 Tax=uncultured Chloroflexus sp. TaxID=214040 RepID=UPI00263A206D|nr:CPBP family intramembrane glutamic endopeptidase [uncultured Chloroflexus sp.]
MPRQLLGSAAWITMWRERVALFSRLNWPVALLWVIVIVIAIVMYAETFVAAPLSLIALAIPLAMINGCGEELLWRGMYVHLFPRNIWLAMVYLSFGFALWHLAPQIIFPAESVIEFVVATLWLGLAYGVIAYRTGAVTWPALAHSLSGIVALSGFLAPSLLVLIANI